MNKIMYFIKRWLVLFLCLIICFSFNKTVKADTSSLSKNIIDDIYAVTLLTNGEEHYYYLDIYKMGDKTVYCVEPGVDITESNYFSMEDLSSLSNSQSIVDYIKKIAFFGYDYFNHQSKEYYMAAQELIWEALGNQVYWSTTFDHSGEIDINFYKNDIKNLISGSNNFSLTDIYLGVHNYDEYITNYNSQLFRYEIISSSVDNVSLSDGVLTIPNNHNLDGQTITFRYKIYTEENPLIFYNGNSQKMISGGNLNFPEYIVTLHTKKGNLNIHKYDSETLSNVVSGSGSLDGAIYELYNYDNSKIDEYSTDINGEIFIDNLEYGTYYLKEISPSKGYKLDDTLYTIEIKDNDNNIDLYEEPIKGNVEIIKTYGEDNIYEEGVIFDIYDNNYELIKSITTDSDGYASIELYYGNYTIKQRNGIDGYEMVADFDVTIDGSEEIYTYTLNDKEIVLPLDDVYYDEVVNPKTGDNIDIYIGGFGIGMILFVIISLFYLKLSKKV